MLEVAHFPAPSSYGAVIIGTAAVAGEGVEVGGVRKGCNGEG